MIDWGYISEYNTSRSNVASKSNSGGSRLLRSRKRLFETMELPFGRVPCGMFTADLFPYKVKVSVMSFARGLA